MQIDQTGDGAGIRPAGAVLLAWWASLLNVAVVLLLLARTDFSCDAGLACILVLPYVGFLLMDAAAVGALGWGIRRHSRAVAGCQFWYSFVKMSLLVLLAASEGAPRDAGDATAMALVFGLWAAVLALYYRGWKSIERNVRAPRHRALMVGCAVLLVLAGLVAQRGQQRRARLEASWNTFVEVDPSNPDFSGLMGNVYPDKSFTGLTNTTISFDSTSQSLCRQFEVRDPAGSVVSPVLLGRDDRIDVYDSYGGCVYRVVIRPA